MHFSWEALYLLEISKGLSNSILLSKKPRYTGDRSTDHSINLKIPLTNKICWVKSSSSSVNSISYSLAFEMRWSKTYWVLTCKFVGILDLSFSMASSEYPEWLQQNPDCFHDSLSPQSQHPSTSLLIDIRWPLWSLLSKQS